MSVPAVILRQSCGGNANDKETWPTDPPDFPNMMISCNLIRVDIINGIPIGNIIGGSGSTGATGATGSTGHIGDTGATGATGPNNSNSVIWTPSGASDSGKVVGDSTQLDAYLTDNPDVFTVYCDSRLGALQVNTVLECNFRIRFLTYDGNTQYTLMNITSSGTLQNPFEINGFNISCNHTPSIAFTNIGTQKSASLNNLILTQSSDVNIIDFNANGTSFLIFCNNLNMSSSFASNLITIQNGTHVDIIVNNGNIGSISELGVIGPVGSSGELNITSAGVSELPLKTQDLTSYVVGVEQPQNIAGFTQPIVLIQSSEQQYPKYLSLFDITNRLANLTSYAFESWSQNAFGAESFTSRVPAKPSYTAGSGAHPTYISDSGWFTLNSSLVYDRSSADFVPTSINAIATWNVGFVSTASGTNLTLRAVVDGAGALCYQEPSVELQSSVFGQMTGIFYIQNWVSGSLRFLVEFNGSITAAFPDMTLKLEAVNPST